MEYLLVDFENIVPKTISELPPDQTVLIFAGEKQTKMKTDLVLSMMARGTKARLIQIKGHGKNALDFHITFYLGKLSDADKSASFRILSNDNGFDALIRHLKEIKVDCSRIDKMTAKSLPKLDLQAKLKAFVAHLDNLPEKARPKKVAKLKAYLKNWAQKDDKVVEPLFNGLLSGKQIEIEGEKVKYIGPTVVNG